MSALTTNRAQTITPTPKTATEARGLLNKIESSRGISVTVNISGASSEEVGPEILDAFKTVLAIIGSGQKAEITATPHDLTTTVAAKRIGVSRPTLMKLIHSGTLPAHKVGSHFRIRTEDADTYRVNMLKKQTTQQQQAFQELRALEDALGITDTE